MVSSMRVVGPCGETEAVWPTGLKKSIPPVADWTYDVGDLMSNCRTTTFTFNWQKLLIERFPLVTERTERRKTTFKKVGVYDFERCKNHPSKTQMHD